MDLSSARNLVQVTLERMRAVYGAAVFDEWVLLSPGAKHGGILAYAGPRVESFGPKITADTAPLRAEVAANPAAVGDLVFALAAKGTHYDVLICAGAASYLVFNHTKRTMLEIRAEAGWLKAQAILFELAEKFRGDPLAAD